MSVEIYTIILTALCAEYSIWKVVTETNRFERMVWVILVAACVLSLWPVDTAPAWQWLLSFSASLGAGPGAETMTELLLGLPPLLIAATALLAPPFGLPVLSWFIGNSIGRVVALIGIVIMSLWLASQLGRKDGVARIRAQETARNLDALRERIAVDESIREMTPEQRRKELRKWVR